MSMGAPKPGSTFQPTPPQGGKGGVQPTQPQSPYTPIGAQGGKAPVPMGGFMGGGGYPAMQPTQVPAQGGKAPLTPEQIDAFKPNVFPGPQVQQPFITPMRDQNPQVAEMIRQGNMQGAMDLQKQLAMQNGKIFPQQPGQVPQVMPMSPQQSPYYDANGRPTAVGTGGPGLLMQPQVQQPAQVMPRPVPQVMPRQPTPKPAPMQPQGLAQLQQMLRGKR
jgi:hypothetical protein